MICVFLTLPKSAVLRIQMEIISVNKMYTALHVGYTKRIQREHDFIKLLIFRFLRVTKISVTI